MSLLVICMLSSLAVVLNTKLGRVLQLTIGLHCVTRKLLNDVALSIQLTINLLFISRGGPSGVLHLFSSLSIIFHYDFWLVWGSVSFTPRSFKYVSSASKIATLQSSRNLSTGILSSLFFNHPFDGFSDPWWIPRSEFGQSTGYEVRHVK